MAPFWVFPLVQVDLSIPPLNPVNEFVKNLFSVHVENPLENASRSVQDLTGPEALAERFMYLPASLLTVRRAIVGIWIRVTETWGVFAPIAYLSGWLPAMNAFSIQRWIFSGHLSNVDCMRSRGNRVWGWGWGFHIESVKEVFWRRLEWSCSKEFDFRDMLVIAFRKVS